MILLVVGIFIQCLPFVIRFLYNGFGFFFQTLFHWNVQLSEDRRLR